ncbi:replication initiator [Streptomyces roseochromogenus]|uniref:replication initiator n=1 Tax=Streptomyces roseochromogenus TaxID=285450 RepID=UPI003158F4DD
MGPMMTRRPRPWPSTSPKGRVRQEPALPPIDRLRGDRVVSRQRTCPHLDAYLLASWWPLRVGPSPSQGLGSYPGYRGHILTKSRAHSTTYAVLRAARASHRADEGELGEDTVTEVAWRYLGSGHIPGAAQLAAGIAEDLAQNGVFAREAMADRGWDE